MAEADGRREEEERRNKKQFNLHVARERERIPLAARSNGVGREVSDVREMRRPPQMENVAVGRRPRGERKRKAINTFCVTRERRSRRPFFSLSL